MSVYGIFRRVVKLIGSPWGFFPVAVVALYAYGVGGHPFDAVPFLIEWALVVGACSWLSKWLRPSRLADLPSNKPMPPSAIAVGIAPVMPPEASADLATMKTRLPANVARLLR